MRVTTSIPWIVLSTASVANALSLHRRDAPAILEAPIKRRQLPGKLAKRDSSYVNVSVTNNEDTSYLMDLTLGTPPQNFTLALDTGSSDLWVIAANTSDQTSTYNSSASSSYTSLNLAYNATYADGTEALGTYATDTLGLGDATVKDFQFVVVANSTSSVGIAGVGYNISTYEAEHDNKVYNNLPYALKASGITKSTAYSLWLNDLDASTGSILFGGVNKAKYIGELQTLPVVPVYNQYYSLALALTEVIVETGSSSTSSSTNLPLAVSLDTGTSFSALPEALVNDVYKVLNATYLDKVGYAYVDCDLMNTDYNVTYSFSGAKINVGLSQLVMDATSPDFPDGTCVFGLVPSQPGLNLLGDTFLRSAYVVYDLDNNEISLANTNFSPGDDDILEIGTGTDAVPGATLVPSAVSSATGNGVETATSGIVSPTGATITTGSASTATSTTGSSTKATSTSSGMAALQTGNVKHIISGLAGAGLLLML